MSITDGFSATTADVETELDRPTPETRVLEGASGTPVVLADGNTWLLADGGLMNDLDAIRDRIDDDARMEGEVSLGDIFQAAGHLLLANYELTIGEIYGLLVVAEYDAQERAQALTDAVKAALFGPTDRQTYSNWAASALIANGLDPANVPGSIRPHVLAHLEATGRCIPRSKFIDSAEAASRRASLRARAQRAQPVPAEPEPVNG